MWIMDIGKESVYTVNHAALYVNYWFINRNLHDIINMDNYAQNTSEKYGAKSNESY